MSINRYFEEPDFLFKIVLVGNSSVGKSSLLKTISERCWEESFTPTIGVDFKIHTFNIDGKVVKLQIWDTAGQERFKCICRSYYKGAHGAILVYDISDQMSFREVENWMEDVEKVGGQGINKLLVGNKCDLETERRVSYDEGKKLAEELGMKFIETSAKTSYNVVDMFKNFARDMKEKIEKTSQPTRKNQREERKDQRINLNENTPVGFLDENKKNASCCYNL